MPGAQSCVEGFTVLTGKEMAEPEAFSCMRFSIVVPVLNEQAQMPELLDHLEHWRERGCEVLLVDGGSDDDTVVLARQRHFPVLTGARGRARRMNLGAGQASGDVLVFLHADTRLPASAMADIGNSLRDGKWRWGRFDVRITGAHPMFPVIARMMNWRSRWTGIATGDQAMFMQRSVWDALNGFPDQALMEDVALSRRLLSEAGRPCCLRARVQTSGRRWEQRGAWRTILLMWRLRWHYWRGVPVDRLAELYQ